jgi:hypothetical protein
MFPSDGGRSSAPQGAAMLRMDELDRLPLLVTPKALAAALGVNAKTLRRWEMLRGFPAAKRGPGQRALYNREAVRAWLLTQESNRN